MRILHVITSLRIGGAEKLVANLSRLMNQGGDVVEIAVFDGSETALMKGVVDFGIKVHVLGRGYYNMWNPLNVLKLRHIIKQGKYDIVHAHNYTPQLFSILARGKKSPVMLTTEHNTSNRRRGNWIFKKLDRWMYSKFAEIICVSEKTHRNLLAHLNLSDTNGKFEVVHNGIDLTDSCMPSTGVKDGATRIIVMVAAFRRQKDQGTLIKSLTLLPEDYKLWLLGDGTTRRENERLVHDLGLDARVRFWGNRNDVAQLIQQCDVVVLSSKYEGLSLSSLEAMASGKPFIASNVEGIKEIVGDGALLFEPGNHEDLADKVKMVCDNQHLASELVGRALVHVKQYDIKKTIEAYRNVYSRYS